MKHVKHPATILAALALFFALGGGAAWASSLISGSKIKNHSIPARKLTRSAIRSLHGQRGATGPAGPKGDTGATGPQGPGGSIISYDATASATPTTTTIGTVLGDTISVQCNVSPGSARLTVLLKTSDGSWRADYGYVTAGNGSSLSDASHFDDAAGTLSSPTEVDGVSASTASANETESQVDFAQLLPSAGSMIWHEDVSTRGVNPTCHMSVQSFPETITKISG